MTKHQCKLGDMTWGEEPNIDAGECVSFKVTCQVCGKEFEEVYTRNQGLYDPDTQDYVELQ